MGFLNKLFGNSTSTEQKKPISTMQVTGKRVRLWGVSYEDGTSFGTYAIYQSARGFQIECTAGAFTGLPVQAGSIKGFYPDLKAAMHGCLCQLSTLVCVVLNAKVDSLETGQPWEIRNPQQLILLDTTWVKEAKGVFPLGQVFLDEGKLEVVEALMADPDTCKKYDRVGCRVLAGAIRRC